MLKEKCGTKLGGYKQVYNKGQVLGLAGDNMFFLFWHNMVAEQIQYSKPIRKGK